MYKKYLLYAVPLLLALGIGLGLLQRQYNSYIGGDAPAAERLTKLPSSGGSLRDYYQKAQSAAPQQPQAATATFLAVGDIMLSRNVAGTISKSNNIDLPFSGMADILKSTDFNFANLESPISGSNYFNPSGSMVFNAPTAYTAGLTDYNFKILNLANNHAFDQGLKGLDYTRSFLDKLNIAHEGTGDTLDQAWQPAVVTTSNGLKICFVGASYASINDNGKTTNDYVARIEDLQRLKSSILNLKSSCDFIVATMHAGTEYTRTPNDAQTAFAHAAIDDGADIVIGAHPHWVQTIEKYNGKYIFYSLGNFVFDQMWSQDTREGLTLKIQISKSNPPAGGPNPTTPQAANLEDLQGPRQPAQLDSIQLIPVIIDNYSTPRPTTPKEARQILDKINQQDQILP